jgi:hypothetical protein
MKAGDQMPSSRTAALGLPFAVALTLLAGCSAASSTLAGTAQTGSAAHSSSTATPVAPASVSASAVPSASRPATTAAPASGSTATATATASGTASPSAGEVYFAESGDVNGTVVYEPSCRSGCQLSGDGTTGLWDMTWSTWTTAEAVGTGTEKIDDCNPDCAAGTLHAVAVTVTFSKPVKAACDPGSARLYWTRASFSWPDGLPAALSGQDAPLNPFTYPEIGGSGACG